MVLRGFIHQVIADSLAQVLPPQKLPLAVWAPVAVPALVVCCNDLDPKFLHHATAIVLARVFASAGWRFTIKEITEVGL